MSSAPISTFPLYGHWNITQIDNETGEVLYNEKSKNIVVKTGRAELLKLLFNVGTSYFLFLGAGASSTAATVNDTRLVYEHILNSSRVDVTDGSGGALDSSDVVDDVTTIDSVNYYKSITVRGEYDGSTDNNVNQPFQEYGLFSSDTLPGTPTGTSGNMLNRFVANQAITLDTSTTIVVEIILHC